MCHGVSKAKPEGVCAKQGWKVDLRGEQKRKPDASFPSRFGLAYMAILLINKSLS